MVQLQLQKLNTISVQMQHAKLAGDNPSKEKQKNLKIV